MFKFSSYILEACVNISLGRRCLWFCQNSSIRYLGCIIILCWSSKRVEIARLIRMFPQFSLLGFQQWPWDGSSYLMKTMPGPGSSSRLFHNISSLYLKLSNEGMALINQIEVTTSCGEEYQSDWLILFASPVCRLCLVPGCHRGDCYLTRAMAAPAPGVITSTPSTPRHRAQSCTTTRESLERSRQTGLGLIIQAYEISSGTSLITRAAIKHRHLFLSSTDPLAFVQKCHESDRCHKSVKLSCVATIPWIISTVSKYKCCCSKQTSKI